MAALTVTEAGLALYHLGSRSLWFDEGSTWMFATQSLAGVWRAALATGGHLLAYYLVVHVVTGAFGAGVDALRFPSVLAGVATVPLMFLLARRLGGDRAGLYATALFAVSLPFVFWEQNARVYSVVVLLAVATTLTLVVAIQTGSNWALGGWGLLGVLACYSHPESALLLVAQILVVAVSPLARHLRLRVLVVIGALVVVVSPPALVVLSHHSSQRAFIVPPNLSIVGGVVTFLASGAGSWAKVTPIDDALALVTAGVWIAGLAVFVVDLGRRRSPERTFSLLVALAGLAVPPILSFLVSVLFTPVFIDRYLLVSLPFASLLLALTLCRLEPRTLTAPAVAYLCLFRFGVLAPTYSVPLDDYAQATAFVVAHTHHGDCIAFDANTGRILYDYYISHPPAGGPGVIRVPGQVLPFAPSGAPPSVVARYAALTHHTLATADQNVVDIALAAYLCKRIWLYATAFGSPRGTPVERRDLAEYLTFRSELQSFFSAPRITRFPGVSILLFRGHLEGSPPSTTVPSTTVPSTTVPSTTVPSTTVPSTTVPSTTVPSTTFPSTTVPSTTVPSTTVPSTTVPSTTVPSTTVPSAGA